MSTNFLGFGIGKMEVLMLGDKKSLHADVPLTAFCGDLRSKKFYGRDSLATEAGDYLDSTGHCWCFHTQQPVGPDGGQVVPEACISSRECYRSALHPHVRNVV